MTQLLLQEAHVCACIIPPSYGFSLEECRERVRGEEVARRALSLDKRTPFATHAMGKQSLRIMVTVYINSSKCVLILFACMLIQRPMLCLA